MKLLITRQLPQAVLDEADAAFEVELTQTNAALDVATAREALTSFDVILPTLGDAFGADTFEGLGDCRCGLLANFGVGYNHIDVAAAQAASVQVSNTPGAVTDATADIALTLMLMTARRAGEGERIVRAGRWHGWAPTQMLGLHMTGKTLGVIGMGRIGKAIAKRAHFGFDMDVVFFNRSEVSDAPVPATQLASIADVMARADIVVIAVPGSPTTHHLIDAKALASMKPTGHLVNIARGDVVDEAALIAALEAGQIAGAGLDVYEREPEVPDALKRLENVTLLPHLGTAALEVRENMGRMALANAIAFSKGEVPPNLV